MVREGNEREEGRKERRACGGITSHILLVGVEGGEATVTNSMQILQRTNTTHPLGVGLCVPLAGPAVMEACGHLGQERLGARHLGQVLSLVLRANHNAKC